MPFTEDLAPFFNPREFGTWATRTSQSGAVSTSVLLFDENGVVVESLGVQTSGPCALCPASLWPGIAEGDSIAFTDSLGRLRTFKLRSMMPLDDGAVLVLTLANR